MRKATCACGTSFFCPLDDNGGIVTCPGCNKPHAVPARRTATGIRTVQPPLEIPEPLAPSELPETAQPEPSNGAAPLAPIEPPTAPEPADDLELIKPTVPQAQVKNEAEPTPAQ